MKTTPHKRVIYTRINWRTITISLTILACAYMAHLGNVNQMKLVQDEKVVEFPKATVDVEKIKNNTLQSDCEKTGGTFIDNECTYTKEQMEAKVKKYFPNSWKDVLVIVEAEGGWSMEKQNWNCYYKGEWKSYKRADGHMGYKPVVTDWTPLSEKGKGVMSTSCRKQDRSFAFSTDCFLLQKNYMGRKECPKDVTIDEHLQEVATMTKSRGLTIFSSVWTNNYLTYK